MTYLAAVNQRIATLTPADGSPAHVRLRGCWSRGKVDAQTSILIATQRGGSGAQKRGCREATSMIPSTPRCGYRGRFYGKGPTLLGVRGRPLSGIPKDAAQNVTSPRIGIKITPVIDRSDGPPRPLFAFANVEGPAAVYHQPFLDAIVWGPDRLLGGPTEIYAGLLTNGGGTTTLKRRGSIEGRDGSC